MQRLVDRQARLLEYSAEARGFDEYYDRAIGMLTSDKVRQAFDLSSEPAEVRDRYGRTTYGQGCLLARRLVEAGVKFVTVYFSNNIGGRSDTSGGWDTHGFDNTRMFPIVEKYHFPTHRSRRCRRCSTTWTSAACLDDTLVLWMGEFGRTPKINANVSRDHWPQCYTALLAGGGVKRGYRLWQERRHRLVSRRAPGPARRPGRHALLPDGHQPRSRSHRPQQPPAGHRRQAGAGCRGLARRV